MSVATSEPILQSSEKKSAHTQHPLKAALSEPAALTDALTPQTFRRQKTSASSKHFRQPLDSLAKANIVLGSLQMDPNSRSIVRPRFSGTRTNAPSLGEASMSFGESRDPWVSTGNDSVGLVLLV